MEELEKKKEILKAVKEAVSSMNLESDFEDLEVNDKLVSEIEEKIIKLGGKNGVGRLHL